MYEVENNQETRESSVKIVANRAVNAVLITSDTNSRNPITRMSEKLRIRALRRYHTPDFPVPGTFQITFKAACNSLNTAVAVTIKVPIPTIVAMMPERVLLAFLSIA